MKKTIAILFSLQILISCSDIQMSQWVFEIHNISNNDIVLKKFNTFLKTEKIYVIKQNQTIEFSASSETLNGIPPDADSIVINVLEKKIIDCCKNANSITCQKTNSFFSIKSYEKTVVEKRKVLKTYYTYTFSNEDIKKAQ